MHRTVTTALDVLGLLTLAAGVFFALQPMWGGAALLASGAMVLAGSAAAAWLAERRDGEEPQ